MLNNETEVLNTEWYWTKVMAGASLQGAKALCFSRSKEELVHNFWPGDQPSLVVSLIVTQYKKLSLEWMRSLGDYFCKRILMRELQTSAKYRRQNCSVCDNKNKMYRATYKTHC